MSSQYDLSNQLLIHNFSSKLSVFMMIFQVIFELETPTIVFQYAESKDKGNTSHSCVFSGY